MAPRILVVDDDRALQTLLSVLFTRAGFECDFVSDGNEAIEKLDGDGDGNGQSYAVIMLDLILPGVSGMEILNHLEEKNPALLPRTIVLTGASGGVLKGIDTSRVHAVIRKPFDIQDVLNLTAECAYRE
ncbi:MAG TPA: response regulator [Thermoanaerobaculia bacterium]|jgi:CheY-like chemotaxis protein